MVIKNKKPKARNVVLVSLGLLAATCFVIVLSMNFGVFNHEPAVKKPSTENQKKSQQADTQNKQDFIENGAGNNTSGSSNQSEKTNIALSMSQNGSNVIITTKLYSYSDGMCSLVIRNGSSTFTQTATVLYAPQFSTCEGFSVPITKLGTGSWLATLSVTSKGTTASSSASLEVK